MVQTADDYVFFWKPDQPHGWAGQWYPSPFTVKVQLDDEEKDVLFPSAEHWMMFQKAILFSDFAVARKVVAITTTDVSDLARVKALGREVQNFTDETWNANRARIVLEGSLHKYRQNADLRDQLLATGDKHLVEASPRDRIWGVGFGAKNALNRKADWGLNLLGKALEEAREILRKDVENDSQ